MSTSSDLHLEAELLVEGAERLVEEEDGRPGDQGAGERDALALAAGKLADAAVVLAGEADEARAPGGRSASAPRRARRAP